MIVQLMIEWEILSSQQRRSPGDDASENKSPCAFRRTSSPGGGVGQGADGRTRTSYVGSIATRAGCDLRACLAGVRRSTGIIAGEQAGRSLPAASLSSSATSLVLGNGGLAAVIVRLDGAHHSPEHLGFWCLEAGFGKCAVSPGGEHLWSTTAGAEARVQERLSSSLYSQPVPS
jgi:hypothetical protein